MKYKWLALALVAALPAAVVAQDAPKDQTNQDVSPPSQPEQERAKADMARAKADLDRANRDAKAYERALSKVKEQKQLKAAWLGLSASQPPQALRRQLKLPDGTGLVIDFIQPDSPASKVGLKQYDLLTKLNDQILVNAEQLSVLVRTFKPGNKVRLEFLREGDRQSVEAELIEHEVPPLSDDVGFGGIQQFEFRPAPIDGFGGRAGIGSGGGGGGGVSNRVRRGDVQVEAHTISLVDGKRQFSIDARDGQRMLTVLDTRSGRVMSKFPIDSDEQIQALPADIKEPVSRLLPMLDISSDRPTPASKGTGGNSMPRGEQSTNDAKPAASVIPRTR
jgi:hypothetical protein